MNEPSLDTILACPNLPSLPTVAVDVLELTGQENVKVRDIERVVQYDPALVGKILKTVNSSYYGLSKPCPTIGRALTYLGLNTVKSLVLGFTLVDLTNDDSCVDLMEYWLRCLSAAAAARRLAALAGGCDQEEAFIAALMQDIGMLALQSALGTDYKAILAATDGDHDRLPDAEIEALGFDHAEVGARLGEKWRLPEELTMPIRFHHQRRPNPPSQARLVNVVSLAYQLSSVFAEGADDALLRRAIHLAEQRLELTGDNVRNVVSSTTEDIRELSGLFKVNVGSLPDVSMLLAEAQDAQFAHQVAVVRQAEELQHANAKLAEQAYTDGLTKVANRKRFDDTLQQAFDDAKASGGSVALILVDADKFKGFNDTYGHQAGDLVLIELARRFTEVTGDQGLVCRYGGEEFAVILPDCNRLDAAPIAEALRQAVCTTPFNLSEVDGAPDQVTVTSSFGVAACEPATEEMLNSPAIMILAADKAMYAAKQGGRNCVRIFKPRPRSTAA